MNAESHELDLQLSALTQWPGGAPRLWQGVLEKLRPTMTGPRAAARSGPSWVVLLLLGTFALILIAAVMLPSMGKARASARSMAKVDAGYLSLAAAPPAPPAPEVDDLAAISAPPAGRMSAMYSVTANTQPSSRGPAETNQTGDRQVVRKSTIDIKTPDVRGTFAKALHVVSDASGEFIEESSLSGDGPGMTGTLTLRVAATRLGEVLKQLSDLGVVTAQTSTGQDVTDRVVDIDARLRNEQRIETELLDLIGKKPSATLKEVSDLRAELMGIRERIEQITAQRDRMARLVNLATVIVIVHADNAPPEAPKAAALTEYFKKEMGSSWRASLEFLADSLGLVVKVFVGGLVLWVLLALAIAGSVALRRRAVRAAAMEPAPG